jgi:hypothetical protein
MLRSVRLAVLGLGLLGAPACRVADAKVWNLRQVHDFDGSPKHVGNVKSDLRFVVDQAVVTTGFAGKDLLVGTEERIEDPRSVCLENLIELGDCERDARTLALQAEMYSWLAVDDPYALARERAVQELAEVGQALGIGSPAPFDPDQEPAKPLDVGGALKDLIATGEAVLAERAGGEEEAALAQACREAEALPYDRDGARRMLSATTILLGGRDYSAGAMQPLRSLQLHTARLAVRYALAASLSDKDERVRAAGVQSVDRIQEHRDARLLLAALADRSPVVQQRALVLIRRHGLPLAQDAGPAPDPGTPPPTPAPELEATRETFLQELVRRAQSLEGPVSVAACRALGKVSGAGFDSLRPEEWGLWWDERQARADARAAAAEASAP